MELGLIATTFQGSLSRGIIDPAWLIDRAAAAGLTSLAVIPPADTQVDCARLRNRAEVAGIRLEMLAGSLGREGDGPQSLTPILERALLLGARRVRVRLGFRYAYQDRNRQRANLDRAARCLETMLPTLESACVTMAIENCGEATSKELAQLVGSLGHPLLGVCIDVAHNVALYEDPVHTARVLAPHAVMVHLRDMVFTAGSVVAGRPCALGEGDLDLPRIIQAIHERAPEEAPTFGIEVPVGSGPTTGHVLQAEEQALEETLAYCTETLGFSPRQVYAAGEEKQAA